MNFINLIGLISTVVSKASSPEFHFQIDFREMRKRMGISFVTDIPEFSTDFITLASGKVYAGSIVIRPLDVLGGTTIEYHYGVVLGTSMGGKELIIEMTKSRNVNVVTKDVFLAGFSLDEMEVYSRPKEVTRDQVIERAKKFEHDSYSLLDLNCKDFALYCVFTIEPKKRSKDLVKGCIGANELSIAYWRWALTSADVGSKKFAAKMLSEMEANKRRLEKRLENYSEE